MVATQVFAAITENAAARCDRRTAGARYFASSTARTFLASTDEV
jgi:hypothetical protein